MSYEDVAREFAVPIERVMAIRGRVEIFGVRDLRLLLDRYPTNELNRAVTAVRLAELEGHADIGEG